MYNPTRLLGVIAAVTLAVTASATANAADLTPVPDTNVSVSTPVVDGCSITVTGEATPTQTYNPLVALRVNGQPDENTGVATLQTVGATAPVPFSLTATVTANGSYPIDLFWSLGADLVAFYDFGNIDVTNCSSTPVKPTLSATATGDCTFDVLYTGDRPQLSLSAKGKKVIQTIAAVDSSPGVVNYLIDATGAPSKGKKADIYTVSVKADNGLSASVKVGCR